MESSLLFAGGVCVLCVAIILMAVGAFWWGKAVQAFHTARAHGYSADEQVTLTREAHDAVDAAEERAPYEPVAPSDNDLLEAIRAQRRDRDSEVAEYSTMGNEGIPDSPPIPDGNFYTGATP